MKINTQPYKIYFKQSDNNLNFANKKNIFPEENKKNMTAKIAIGTALLSTLLMFIRTDKTRIQKILTNNGKDLKNTIKGTNIEIEIKNFKNNKNIKSIDELSGLENIKEFFNEYELLIKNPEAMKEHKIKKFSSMLFWGVPGTGKTSAAKGIAKKLEADYIQIDKEFFDSMFVSEGPKRLAEMISQIEKHAKDFPKKRIIVFMDEIDGTISIDKSNVAHHSEDLINTLKKGLTYLQEECENIIFIGATNKDPNGIKSDNTTVRLNPAILSRFKYQMEFKLPCKDAINEAWSNLIKTTSGKEKFTNLQNEIISKKFHELSMSYRDIDYIADKLNHTDAVEFCQKGSYNSKRNLIKVLKNDEKIGYDPVNKKNLDADKFNKIIEDLKKALI